MDESTFIGSKFSFLNFIFDEIPVASDGRPTWGYSVCPCPLKKDAKPIWVNSQSSLLLTFKVGDFGVILALYGLIGVVGV